jgi:cell volume regulation protein A
MTGTIIITFCILLLIAYLFDVSSSKTRIPSVILLLALGWLVRQFTRFLDISLPDFSDVFPVLGTLGLVLIVLEGSLELELRRSKIGLIVRSFFGAALPIAAGAVLLAFLIQPVTGAPFRDCLLNVIPFCVISSAIAIPSVRHLSSHTREFVIYESSLSDILGVLLFNFIALNESVSAGAFTRFGVDLLIIFTVSLAATIGLSYLLHRIGHPIKFVPIILLLILVYEVAKEYDLPSLIFILIFGLFIGNLGLLKRFRWIQRFNPEELEEEADRLKDLVIEASFLIRSLFFLLFGYLIETADLLDGSTVEWALAIVGILLLLRIIQLLVSGLPLLPLLFIAPKGLITILLFLSIAPARKIPLVNKPLVVQVIVISALVMMAGLIVSRGKPKSRTLMPEPEEGKEPTAGPL